MKKQNVSRMIGIGLLLACILAALALTGCDLLGSAATQPDKEQECQHTRTEWVVYQEPTCWAKGERGKKCLDCRKTLETETMDPLQHDYVEKVCRYCHSILIESAEDLVAFAERVNEGDPFSGRAVTLTQDLDMTGRQWVPVGEFKGFFDGQGHVIRGLDTKNLKNGKYPTPMLIGFFAINDGIIRDLGLVDLALRYDGAIQYIGGLVAQNSGLVQGCWVTGHVNGDSTGSVVAGGLIGENFDTVERCYSAAVVTAYGFTKGNTGAYADVGGLVGVNTGAIRNCFATGEVSASAEATKTGKTGTKAGGLCAWNQGGEIANCYATAYVSAMGTEYCYAGGLVGRGGTISRSFATGDVSVKSSKFMLGGLVGSANAEDVTDSYYTAEEKDTPGTHIDRDVLLTAAFLRDTLGWDAAIWQWKDGEYPTFQ